MTDDDNDRPAGEIDFGDVINPSPADKELGLRITAACIDGDLKRGYTALQDVCLQGVETLVRVLLAQSHLIMDILYASGQSREEAQTLIGNLILEAREDEPDAETR
jgi:hypothetical protein